MLQSRLLSPFPLLSHGYDSHQNQQSGVCFTKGHALFLMGCISVFLEQLQLHHSAVLDSACTLNYSNQGDIKGQCYLLIKCQCSIPICFPGD